MELTPKQELTPKRFWGGGRCWRPSAGRVGPVRAEWGRVGPVRAEWGWGGVGHALGFN